MRTTTTTISSLASSKMNEKFWKKNRTVWRHHNVDWKIHDIKIHQNITTIWSTTTKIQSIDFDRIDWLVFFSHSIPFVFWCSSQNKTGLTCCRPSLLLLLLSSLSFNWLKIKQQQKIGNRYWKKKTVQWYCHCYHSIIYVRMSKKIQLYNSIIMNQNRK